MQSRLQSNVYFGCCTPYLALRAKHLMNKFDSSLEKSLRRSCWRWTAPMPIGCLRPMCARKRRWCWPTDRTWWPELRCTWISSSDRKNACIRNQELLHCRCEHWKEYFCIKRPKHSNIRFAHLKCEIFAKNVRMDACWTAKKSKGLEFVLMHKYSTDHQYIGRAWCEELQANQQNSWFQWRYGSV